MRGLTHSRLALACFSVAFSAAATAEISADWSYFAGPFAPSHAGMVIANVDGIGPPEVIMTGSAMGGTTKPTSKLHLTTIGYSGGGFGIESQLNIAEGWQHVGEIHVVKGLPPDADTVVGMMVNFTAGSSALVSWSGRPLREISRVAPGWEIEIRTIADVDGDGQLEVLGCYCDSQGTGNPITLDLATGAIEFFGSIGFAQLSLGTAQLDSDMALEVLIGGGFVDGEIYDGATWQRQWSYLDGFRGKPLAGNFRANNGQEFAMVNSQGPTRVFVSQPIFSPVVDVKTGPTKTALSVDVDLDGYDDIVVGGDRSTNEVAAYSTLTSQPLFRRPNFSTNVSGLAMDRLDGSNARQLVFAGSNNNLGTGLLQVSDSSNGALRFRTLTIPGPFSALLHFDGDGDGREELLFATTGSSTFNRFELVLLSATNGKEIRRGAISWFNNPAEFPIVSLMPIDLDGNAAMEFAVASTTVAVVDGTSLVPRWQAQTASSDTVFAMTKTRFNADNIDDIVVATMSRLLILNGQNGNELYRSAPFVATAEPRLAAGNVDADAQQEIALSSGLGFRVIDATNGQTQLAGSASQTIRAMRFEVTGTECHLVLTLADRLERMNCASGALVSTRHLGLTANFVGFPNDSRGDLLVATDERVGLLRGTTLAQQSESLGTGLGAGARGALTESDGILTAFVGGDQSVRRVTFRLNESIFANGFE